MFCENCGNKLTPDDKFCDKCGTPKPSSFPVSKKSEVKVTPIVAAHSTHVIPPVQPQPSQHIPAPSSTNNNQGWINKKANRPAIVIAVMVIALLAIFAILSHVNKKKTAASTNSGSYANSQSVVNVVCDSGKGGSGVIFTTDGTVLTNNHVITGSKQCQISIPNPATGQAAKIYNATPVIIPTLSQEYDVATLKIDGAYTDASGTTWGIYPTTFPAFVLPSTCSTSTQSQLNDSVRIYGYPDTSGGYNLTVTDGVISSFADDGSILTSAKVDSGNSGGLAIDQNGCWLGIPSAVVTGNYQNLGVIIPGSVVENFLSGVPAKKEPIAASPNEDAVSAQTVAPEETDDQICQSDFGGYSEATGKKGSDGNPLCDCQNGYSWDTTGNTCVSKISLQQACQNQYGTGSYSHQQNGKAVCGCSTGYQWNSDQTACVVIVQESNDQICQGQYGSNSQWSGQTNSSDEPTCDCQTGYTWDATGNACATQSSLNQSCQNAYGSGSYSFEQNEKAFCGCSDGYQWNPGQTACIAQQSCPSFSSYNSATDQCECINGYTSVGGDCESDNTYCQNKEGYGATYDSSSNSCACQSGYIYNNTQCVSGYTYCSEKYGIGAEYDDSTNGCECGVGYQLNSAGTACVSSYTGY